MLATCSFSAFFCLIESFCICSMSALSRAALNSMLDDASTRFVLVKPDKNSKLCLHLFSINTLLIGIFNISNLEVLANQTLKSSEIKFKHV
jgi:hypothetical protein